MKRIEISLLESFEENKRRALALPDTDGAGGVSDKQIVAALRRLHELAHGRSGDTSIGLIAIGPPIGPGLATERMNVATRKELLAFSRQKRVSTRGGDTHTTAIHFKPTSALSEFLGGSLGAPVFWMDRSTEPPTKRTTNPFTLEEAR